MSQTKLNNRHDEKCNPSASHYLSLPLLVFLSPPLFLSNDRFQLLAQAPLVVIAECKLSAWSECFHRIAALFDRGL